MAKKFTYLWAIIIDGNFMKGKVYYNTKDEAYANLESEVKNGYYKLEKAKPWEQCYYTTDEKYLRGIDGYVGMYLRCADDYEDFITYKVSRVRVPI